jgi:protoheme IX farnesyltransferase
MKLRVVELLLVTTLPALFMASHGVPNLVKTVATLVGGTLAAGASNAYNMVIEVESDKKMARTAKRPLTTGAISPRAAIIFATILAILSLVILAIFTTPLATWLTLAAILFYVLFYTIGLKRRTSQNIVWGGIAGCLPVLIGWAAIQNNLAAPAYWFFALIFFWTPPHFWALAIKYRDEYEAAGIPMLPVVATLKSVQLQSWLHSIAMVVCSGMVLYTDHQSLWIWIPNLVLAGIFLDSVRKLGGADAGKAAARLFQWSITYLSAFSLLLVVGVFVSK